MFWYISKTAGVGFVMDDGNLRRWVGSVDKGGVKKIHPIDETHPYASRDNEGREQLKLIDEHQCWSTSGWTTSTHDLYVHWEHWAEKVDVKGG